IKELQDDNKELLTELDRLEHANLNAQAASNNAQTHTPSSSSSPPSSEWEKEKHSLVERIQSLETSLSQSQHEGKSVSSLEKEMSELKNDNLRLLEMIEANELKMKTHSENHDDGEMRGKIASLERQLEELKGDNMKLLDALEAHESHHS